MTVTFKPRSQHKNPGDYSGKPAKVMDAEAATARGLDWGANIEVNEGVGQRP